MKKILVLFLVLFASPVLQAQAETPADLEKVVSALESPFRSGSDSKAAAIRDFTAEFSQESRLTSLDRVQRGSGRVAVKFDRTEEGSALGTRFRWDYRQPSEQEIVSDGRTLWVYLPENRQVIVSELDETAAEGADNPLTFLTGLGNLSRDFSIEWGSPRRDEEGNYLLELKPRRPSAMISRLLIAVDQEAVGDGRKAVFPLLGASVVDPNGNTTTLEFANVRTNQELSDDLFTFEVPEGVEMVRPSESGFGF